MNKNLIIGAVLLFGAYWYMTKKKANQVTQVQRPMGAGSMPASVGTGAAQALGGILGNALARQMGGGTITGMQPTQPNPTYTADSTINNDAYMADPLASYDPTFSADLGY